MAPRDPEKHILRNSVTRKNNEAECVKFFGGTSL